MMETVYKITDKDDKTRPGKENEKRWGKGVTHTAPGNGEMCSEAYIHAYRSPELAVLMNPIHGQYDEDTMHIWKCVAEVEKDNGVELGCTKVTSLERVEVPIITYNQRQRFAILVTKAVYPHLKNMGQPVWWEWSDRPDGDRDTTLADVYTSYAVTCADVDPNFTYTVAANYIAASGKKIDLQKILEKAIREERD